MLLQKILFLLMIEDILKILFIVSINSCFFQMILMHLFL